VASRKVGSTDAAFYLPSGRVGVYIDSMPHCVRARTGQMALNAYSKRNDTGIRIDDLQIHPYCHVKACESCARRVIIYLGAFEYSQWCEHALGAWPVGWVVFIPYTTKGT
jgi:hypothetical protein